MTCGAHAFVLFLLFITVLLYEFLLRQWFCFFRVFGSMLLLSDRNSRTNLIRSTALAAENERLRSQYNPHKKSSTQKKKKLSTDNNPQEGHFCCLLFPLSCHNLARSLRLHKRTEITIAHPFIASRGVVLDRHAGVPLVTCLRLQ